MKIQNEKNNNSKEAMLAVRDQEPPKLSGDFYSDEIKDFVKTCLQKDPTKRPTASELLHHPFVNVNTSHKILVDLVKSYKSWCGFTNTRKNVRDHLLDREA